MTICKKFCKQVLTVCDADVIMHPNYFEYISSEFVKLKEDGSRMALCTLRANQEFNHPQGTYWA